MGIVDGHDGSSARQTAIFWTAYVTTAYEPIFDFDPDSMTNLSWARTTDGQPNASVLFVEQMRDIITGGLTEAEMRPWVTVHEIGHQFNVAPLPAVEEHRPGSLMAASVATVPAANFFFDPIDIEWIRRFGASS